MRHAATAAPGGLTRPYRGLTRHLARPLAALGLLLATAGAAHAQTTTSFAYTGGTQTYTVPDGVTQLQVVATGGSGGSRATPGNGAQVQATVTVTPGEVLTVVVGGAGANYVSSSQNAGGYNGGGTGYGGGGGGGATDLRRATTTRTDDYLTTRNALVVAGGGGGGGIASGLPGGNGGTPAGGNGTVNGSAAGMPGSGASTNGPGAAGSTRAQPGVQATGGNGATASGAGGGGGYYGGGGGDFGGGGGGSSFVTPTGSSNISYSVATAVGNGALAITPVYTAPTVTTGTPTNITSTSAQVGVTLTSTGGATTEYGAVYVAGMGTPTTSNTKVVTATVTGSAAAAGGAASLPNLTPGTTYTVRAYATNSAGTSYGSPVTFSTVQAVTAAPVVTAPANNSTTSALVVASFTAPANSSLTVYLNGQTGGIYGVDSQGNLSITYSGLAQGTYTLSATAQSSGQAMSAQSNVVTFTVDATPPTATLTTTAGSSTSTAPIPFSVTFSEPVTGFSASGISVVNGTVSSGPTGSGSGPYTFSVTPAGNGVVSVSIRASAAQDAVGNTSTASGTASVAYTAPVATGLSVLYQTGDLGQPNDGQLRPFLQLVNSGTTAVPYSSLTVRYWLTVENFMGSLVTPIDYAKLGTGFVSARYVALATPRQGAFGYIEYAFAAGAGNLAAGSNSGPIYGKAYKPDYSNFNETDDWSYQTSSSFTTNDHVTLYQNGTLIGGTEPAAIDAVTALQVFSASRDASPSTQYISLQLQVRNTGNQPVNYGDVRVRYYFTSDNNQLAEAELDYAKLGNGNVSVRVVKLPAPVSGADSYLELRFDAGLGTFYPLSSTGDILVKLRRSDYQAFDQTNDYSFNAATSLTLNNRITALASNRLVFGTPPNGAPARSAATSQPSTGATIVAAASGPQALTASPNPFGEQLMLRFALPTTQAYTLAVYDGQGRLVQQVASGEAEAEQAQEVAVPTQGYAAGLYLVRLTTASGVQTLKLVKP